MIAHSNNTWTWPNFVCILLDCQRESGFGKYSKKIMTFSIKAGEGGTVPQNRAVGAQLLSKHCVTMSQVRFTIIFVFVSLIELSLDCRGGLNQKSQK